MRHACWVRNRKHCRTSLRLLWTWRFHTVRMVLTLVTAIPLAGYCERKFTGLTQPAVARVTASLVLACSRSGGARETQPQLLSSGHAARLTHGAAATSMSNLLSIPLTLDSFNQVECVIESMSAFPQAYLPSTSIALAVPPQRSRRAAFCASCFRVGQPVCSHSRGKGELTCFAGFDTLAMPF